MARVVGPYPVVDAAPLSATADHAEDDLTRIKGIGPKIDEMLRHHGIVRYEQLAALTSAEIDALDRTQPGLRARLERGDWCGEAGRLQDARDA